MKKKNTIIIFLSIVLFLLVCLLFYRKAYLKINQLFKQPDSKVTIAIDAGHGGFDPGKIGINKALEKDINLSIAKKMKTLLLQKGIKVVMTREDDNGLYKKSDQDIKRADMKNRVNIINSSNALIAVSIHQNSFTQESARGAQIFYYQGSTEGQILAEILQERFKNYLNDGNKRLAKSNNTYYMLKNSKCPLVIVECGFLSNRREAELLCNNEYQDKVVWAIYLGIIDYLTQQNKDEKMPIIRKNNPLSFFH